MKRLVLLSGGLDSTTTLAMIVDKTKSEDSIIALSVNYGQRHDWELECAERVVNYYSGKTPIKHIVTTIPKKVFEGTNSGFLINHEQSVPHISYSAISGVSPSFVPFRNANLLSVATAIAFTHECDEVWAGMHAEDAANWAYPDCTPEFLGAMAAAIYIGTYHKVRLQTPLMHLMKAEVVAIGLGLDAPYEWTRSCYAETKLSCGKCPTCQSRIEAFEINNHTDPIQYEYFADGV